MSREGDGMHKWVQCPSCDGRGELEYEVAVPMGFSTPYGDLTAEWDACDHCHGRGEIEVDDDADDE